MFYLMFGVVIFSFLFVVTCSVCCFCFDTKQGCCREDDSGSDDDGSGKDKRLKNIETMINKMKHDEPVQSNNQYGDSGNPAINYSPQALT